MTMSPMELLLHLDRMVKLISTSGNMMIISTISSELELIKLVHDSDFLRIFIINTGCPQKNWSLGFLLYMQQCQLGLFYETKVSLRDLLV